MKSSKICEMSRPIKQSFVFEGYGDNRELNGLTHAFPTRRSSDLKTTPVRSMGATSVDLPLIYLPAGPMLRGYWNGETLGSGTNHWRSEEHTSELQSLMRISYAVFCFK